MANSKRGDTAGVPADRGKAARDRDNKLVDRAADAKTPEGAMSKLIRLLQEN